MKKQIAMFKQFFGNLSIRKKISILIMAAVFISIATIGYTSYRVSEDIMEETALKSTSTLIELASNKLETSFSKIEEVSVIILSDYDVQSMFKDELTLNERLKLREKIYSTLNRYIMSNKMIHSIALYSFNDNYFLFSPMVEDKTEQQDFLKFIQTSSYDEIIPLKGKSMWMKINKDDEKVSLVRVVNILGTWEGTGILCINVKSSIFEEVSSTLSISEEGAFFLKDMDRTLIYSKYNNESLLQHSMNDSVGVDNRFVSIKGREYYKITDNFTAPDWSIDVYLPSSEIFESRKEIGTSIFGTVIVSVFVTIIIVLIVSDFITRPIFNLRKIMHEVEKGDFSKRFDARYNDEIGFLGKSFNSMIRQIKEYIEEIFDNYQKIREKELETLQMKINPHFLYNNLNTINWMAQDMGADNIEIFSRALANYYRLSLSKGNRIITIQEELEHLNNYIIIQKMRYQEYINFVYDIDESIKKYMIVKLTLQPIVENAIFHGIEGKDGEGEITIRGLRAGDTIVFEITDNGIGMSGEKLLELRKSLTEQTSLGYGLRNVNERIKLYFGEYHGLEIYSEYNEGTKVVVTIPIKEGSDWQNEGSDS